MATVNPDDLVGTKKSFSFYGVDFNRFKLGRKVYEVMEDEDDGYRSYMGTLEDVTDTNGLVFFKRSLDKVLVEVVSDYNWSGYRLVSEKDGHVWLEFGTDNRDDYYPCFVFQYHPRGPK